MMNSCVSYGWTRVKGSRLITASSNRIRGNPSVLFNAWVNKRYCRWNSSLCFSFTASFKWGTNQNSLKLLESSQPLQVWHWYREQSPTNLSNLSNDNFLALRFFNNSRVPKFPMQSVSHIYRNISNQSVSKIPYITLLYCSNAQFHSNPKLISLTKLAIFHLAELLWRD